MDKYTIARSGKFTSTFQWCLVGNSKTSLELSLLLQFQRIKMVGDHGLFLTVGFRSENSKLSGPMLVLIIIFMYAFIETTRRHDRSMFMPCLKVWKKKKKKVAGDGSCLIIAWKYHIIIVKNSNSGHFNVLKLLNIYIYTYLETKTSFNLFNVWSILFA